jgi:hypothetical protein
MGLVKKHDCIHHSGTHEGIACFGFFFGCNNVGITAGHKERATVGIRQFADWKKIIQKLLGRHWPNKILLYFFPHHGT